MTVKFVEDGARMAELLRSPTGVVGRHLIERATVFQEAARQTLADHRQTGCLSDSIVKRVEDLGGEFAIRIIADTTPCSPTRTSYSLMVHEGTQPHEITAKNAGALSFYWAHGPNGPGNYMFQTVHHPGTRPIPFFRDNLPIFAA